MGTQEALTEAASPEQGSSEDTSAESAKLPRVLFLGVVVVSTVVLVACSRGTFLYWDDFLFLGEARESHLTWGYLTDPLFRHFSPVVRLVNLVVVGSVPDHPWVVPLVQFVLLAAVAASVTWLMVVLHGRTAPALAGAVLLAPSLSLVQLGNWWTAAVNIAPALVGFYVSFGAMILVWRGGSRLYAVPCLLGAAIAVLDYELPMLLPGYLGLWLLLFGSGVAGESWRAALRRTWWLGAAVGSICLGAAVNYRLNYYDQVPRPTAADVVQSLVLSLVRTLVPSALGFHDPRSGAFSAFSLVVGCVVLALLVGWLVVTRSGAWRGLLFAGAGWLLPTLALVINRVSIFGVGVVDNAVYFHLPTALFVMGLLQAWRAPRRSSTSVRSWSALRFPRAVVALLILSVAGGYAWSAGPTSRFQLPEGATSSFAAHARASAKALVAAGKPFSVLDSDVPGWVVPSDFGPYNRADRVLGVIGPPLSFDDPSKPLYRLTESGDLAPVAVDWLARAGPASLILRAAPDSAAFPGDDGCFTATSTDSLVWPLDQSLTGPDLVVRTEATVSAATTLRLVVRAVGHHDFDHANGDPHSLTPRRTGVLDTVGPPTVATVRIKGFTPGVRICVTSVSVGRVRGS